MVHEHPQMSGRIATVRRRARVVLACAWPMCIALLAVVAIQVLFATTARDPSIGHGLSYLVLLVGCVWESHLWNCRDRLVQSMDAEVCPRCSYTLARIGAAGDCPECGCPFVRDDVQQFWRDAGH